MLTACSRPLPNLSYGLLMRARVAHRAATVVPRPFVAGTSGVLPRGMDHSTRFSGLCSSASLADVLEALNNQNDKNEGRQGKAATQGGISDRSQSPARVQDRPSPSKTGGSPLQEVAQAARGERTKRGRKGERRAPPTFRYFATCAPGLEDVLAEELRGEQIRAEGVQAQSSGVSFVGDKAVGYRANLWLRSAIRVLVLLYEEDIDPDRRGGDEVYGATRRAAPWERLIGPRQTFSVQASIADNADIPSAQLVTRRVTDAVCDAIRDARYDKPEAPFSRQEADLPLFVTVFREHMMIYRDMSGVSLHRRGYRSGAIHKAALNEAAAAGALLIAGWPEAAAQGATLADPMCGSGTFLVEAALMACNVAPGLARSGWPFLGWPDYDDMLWRDALREAGAAAKPWRGRLLGCDAHPGAVELALDAAEDAGVGKFIEIHEGDCGRWRPDAKVDFVITNPPWGQRIMSSQTAGPRDDRRRRYQDDGRDELEEAWATLGSFLKGNCGGANAYVLSGSPELTRALRMRAARKYPLGIGGATCRLLKYEVLPPLTDEKRAELAKRKQGRKFDR